ncbi:MAG TPA: Gfo/Idh/MocA family oxidoreductase [Chloroflexota bacterium]|nr:Gfo/Idh/MocA family oxidoreductase [Chloroflexota bacterium]
MGAAERAADRPLGVAIHGAGWVAAEYLKAFSRNPDVRVRVVSSRREESVRARLAEAGVRADVETDYERVLRRDDVDIVAICTPNERHPAETIAAAQAGKHIVIEKPVAMDVESLRAMREAVRRARVKTVTGFVLRWHPYFRTIKALIADGALGDVFLAETGYYSQIGPWYSGFEWARTRARGGSNLLFAGCHAVDALRWFAGDVSEVCAFEARGHETAWEYAPTIATTMKLAAGGVAVLTSSFEVPIPYTFPVQLHGTKGAFRDGRLYSTEKLPGQTDWATIPTLALGSPDVSFFPFGALVDHFVECIRTDVESHCNLEDAAKTHEVCLAADRSAAEGGRPVKLPL